MHQKSIQLAIVATILLVGPCCGFYAYIKLEQRAAVMKIPPRQLPGHVMVYSAPG
jgi:hypothetical protein